MENFTHKKMIIGVDLSTYSLALATINDNEVKTTLLTSKKKEWMERYKDLFFQFHNKISEIKQESNLSIFIEEPPFVQNHQTFSKLIRALSICEQTCFLNNIPFFIINNKTWKAGLMGGNATKSDIKDFAKLIFGDMIESLTPDEIDALCIARWGYLRINS